MRVFCCLSMFYTRTDTEECIDKFSDEISETFLNNEENENVYDSSSMQQP